MLFISFTLTCSDMNGSMLEGFDIYRWVCPCDPDHEKQLDNVYFITKVHTQEMPQSFRSV